MKKTVLPTLSNVLSATSDNYSLRLFDAIATGGADHVFAKNLQMIRKQFYTRIREVTSYGLIKGRFGKYTLTYFGEIVYSAQRIMIKAISERWKFGAIDSIKNNNMPFCTDDYVKLIENLIDDVDLKGIVLDKKSQSNIIDSYDNNAVEIPKASQEMMENEVSS